ncbi:hypothetical protein ACOMHN_021540 [Nucella lapillus]
MPLKRGRLKPEDKYKVTTNYKYLTDNFDPVNGAADYMYTKLVFDSHDKDRVMNGGETTALGRVQRFIEILENSGQNAYKVFLEALQETGDKHVAKELENTPVPEENRKDPLSWIDELPESVKGQCPNGADASRLSVTFGKGWEHVFAELKVPKAKVDQALMSSPHSISVAITNLINRWKQKNGSSAHFILLLDAMRNAEDRCTIDWEAVKKVVEDKYK